ncbi:hypothetical protein [Aquimarina hainanensis]|uniref:hypothetical protein n=1 Tax=Aquimarina hainanensis TaxID=1578017 RepID=UPI0036114593
MSLIIFSIVAIDAIILFTSSVENAVEIKLLVAILFLCHPEKRKTMLIETKVVIIRGLSV